MTNSTWILIITIEGIEQNQMQDMKKPRFSSHKNNIFYYVRLKSLFFEEQKKIVLVQTKQCTVGLQRKKSKNHDKWVNLSWNENTNWNA